VPALAEAMDDGHCGLPAEELVSLTEKLLEVPAQLVETALGLELDDGAVVADDLDGRRCIFLAPLYRAEREIAEQLKTLAARKPPWPSIDVDKAIPWVEQRTKLALADSQKAALRAALVSKVMVITGGPGVGKTTLVDSLLKILIARSVTIALCAPTGRAAKRLTESTGLEAKTIHRLLETDPRTGHFRRDENETLDCDLLVTAAAGIGDEHIDPPPFPDDPGHHGLDCLVVTHIDLDPQCRPARCLDLGDGIYTGHILRLGLELLVRTQVEVGDRQLGAKPGKPLGICPPEASCRARYDHHLSV
jgi:exodeoxyribonuclease V alpha subunit